MPRLSSNVIKRAYKISRLLPLVLQGARTLESATNELRWMREHVEELSKSPKTKLGPIPKSRGIFRSSRKSFQSQTLRYGRRVEEQGVGRWSRYPSSQSRVHTATKLALSSRGSCKPEPRLLQLCRRRARGEPLQYILGSQPFGPLSIKCLPGVLIPRLETENYTLHVANLLNADTLHPCLTQTRLLQREMKSSLGSEREGANQPKPRIRVLDMCSGTGCISLLLAASLSKRFACDMTSLDISPQAIALSRRNLALAVQEGHIPSPSTYMQATTNFEYIQGDALTISLKGRYDIIISNPPYISGNHFKTETTRSVRNFEPSLALVPRTKVYQPPSLKDHPEDVFYYKIFKLWMKKQSMVLVMEIGDEEQAKRVAKWVSKKQKGGYLSIQIWRDNPAEEEHPGSSTTIKIDGASIPVLGTGSMRSVVCLRKSSPGSLAHLQQMEEAKAVKEKKLEELTARRTKAAQRKMLHNAFFGSKNSYKLKKILRGKYQSWK